MDPSKPPEAALVLAGAPLAQPGGPVDTLIARVNVGSRRTLRGALRAALAALTGAPAATDDATRAFPWHQIGYQGALALREALSRGVAPATANVRLAAVRGVLGEARNLGLLSAEDADRTRRGLQVVPGESEPAGRMLTREELAALLGAAKTPRDRALLALGIYSGLRRAELAALEPGDVTLGPPAKVTVRHGKGGRRREVFVAPEAVVPLHGWLVTRGLRPGRLFGLGPTGVWELLRRTVKRAGLVDVTPHDLRRTFASTLLDAGVDLATVQALMGHRNPKTTASYDRRGDAAKIEAAVRLAKAFAPK